MSIKVLALFENKLCKISEILWFDGHRLWNLRGSAESKRSGPATRQFPFLGNPSVHSWRPTTGEKRLADLWPGWVHQCCSRFPNAIFMWLEKLLFSNQWRIHTLLPRFMAPWGNTLFEYVILGVWRRRSDQMSMGKLWPRVRQEK